MLSLHDVTILGKKYQENLKNKNSFQSLSKYLMSYQLRLGSSLSEQKPINYQLQCV